MGLSAVILSRQDSKELRRLVESTKFADETIVVFDQKETKIHLGIPGAKVYYRPIEEDFAAQRNFAISKAAFDWIFFIDDDEMVSVELAKEIKKVITSDRFAAYAVPRRDVYFGQTLRYGETGNIKIIRLAKKTAGEFIRPVHEFWQVRGRVGELRHPLLHLRGDLVTPFIDRIILYGPIDARSLDQEGKVFNWWRVLFNPLGKFVMNYKVKLGFLDGYLGLFQAYLMSVQSLSVRVFQWQNKSLSK